MLPVGKRSVERKLYDIAGNNALPVPNLRRLTMKAQFLFYPLIIVMLVWQIACTRQDNLAAPEVPLHIEEVLKRYEAKAPPRASVK